MWPWKLHGWLKESLGLDLGYSTTVRYLHEMGYNLRVPRPWPERQIQADREAFLERLPDGRWVGMGRRCRLVYSSPSSTFQ